MKAHLVRFLAVVLFAIVLLRLVVVLVINGDRLPGDKLEGLDIHGRYYPVEKVCLVVDNDDLEDGLAGTPLDQGRFSLSPIGNTFEIGHENGVVRVGCGWENRGATDNPDVSYDFTAVLLTDASKNTHSCASDAHGQRFTTIKLGDYSACRVADSSSVSTTVIDDNTIVYCDVRALDGTLLPGLERAMLNPCAGFVERLSRSRPITYAGNAFLTVR